MFIFMFYACFGVFSVALVLIESLVEARVLLKTAAQSVALVAIRLSHLLAVVGSVFLATVLLTNMR